MVLPLAMLLWAAVINQLVHVVRRAIHILPGWRADLTFTLSVIVGGSSLAYIALWVLGPEGMFVMYLAHVTTLTLFVDLISHLAFVGFLLSDGARLEGLAASDPLLERPRNLDHDKPVTVEGFPRRSTSELV